MIVGMTLLLWQHQSESRLSQITDAPRRLLTCRFSLFLGDVSYSVYLLHLMLVIPVIGLLVRYTAFAHQPSLIRFLIVTVIALPVIWLIAMVLYHKVEKRGIALGKRLISRAALKSQRATS